MLTGMMASGFDQAAQAQSNLVVGLTKQLALQSGILKAQATSGAASGLKGIGEKKAGGDKGPQHKLEELRAEADLLRAEVTGNAELTREMRVQKEISKAVSDDLRARNPALAMQLENQIRINDELKKQVETFATLKSLGTQIGDSISNSFMSIGDGTKKASEAMKQLAVDIIKAIVQATILKPLINQFSNGFAGALTLVFGASLSKDGGGLLGLSITHKYRDRCRRADVNILESLESVVIPCRASDSRLRVLDSDKKQQNADGAI